MRPAGGAKTVRFGGVLIRINIAPPMLVTRPYCTRTHSEPRQTGPLSDTADPEHAGVVVCYDVLSTWLVGRERPSSQTPHWHELSTIDHHTRLSSRQPSSQHDPIQRLRDQIPSRISPRLQKRTHHRVLTSPQEHHQLSLLNTTFPPPKPSARPRNALMSPTYPTGSSGPLSGAAVYSSCSISVNPVPPD